MTDREQRMRIRDIIKRVEYLQQRAKVPNKPNMRRRKVILSERGPYVFVKGGSGLWDSDLESFVFISALLS